jgi:hypothetical protein
MPKAHSNFDSVKMKNLILFFHFHTIFQIYACLLRARAEKFGQYARPDSSSPLLELGKIIFYYIFPGSKIG